MLYCHHCGVQVEPEHQVCPLCREVLDPSADALPPASQAFASVHEDTGPSSEQVLHKRGLIMVVYSVILAIPALICLVVDQLYHGNGWSGYVLLSLGLAWVLLYIPLYFMNHSLTGSMSMILSVAAFLLGIDYMDGRIEWALSLAIPLLAWTALAVFAAWLSFHALYHTMAFAFSGLVSSIAMLCLGIEISVDLFVHGLVILEWSLVVLAASLPLIVIGLVLGFTWKRSARLRRFLHW